VIVISVFSKTSTKPFELPRALLTVFEIG